LINRTCVQTSCFIG